MEGFMDKDIKDDLKKLAKDTEVKLTESILRWKYKKEGKKMPDKEVLEHNSRLVADKANSILSRRGKSILNEFKKAYRESKKRGDSLD
jgi:hypothetical protein